MPVDNSRLPGFHKLSVAERRRKVVEMAHLDAADIATLENYGELDEEAANRMIENVIGTMSLPVGIATNFVIDGKPYVVPYAVEESSVVAAASNMAKRCLVKGGFRTNNDKPIMIGQIQVINVEDHVAAEKIIFDAKEEIIAKCNSLPSTMVRLGGGCKDILTRSIQSISGPMFVIHILVDCRDAMGANAVNRMAEMLSSDIESLIGGSVKLKILSNLATHRLARVSATWTPEELSLDGSRESGESVIWGIINAYHFADADPFRAATHNKGIMNAISSVAVACGQDWRAIEAGCHSWAAYNNGRYSSITHWEVNSNGDLHGSIECPMAVGIVGGASKVHPAAKANLNILGVESSQELAGVIAATGLSQNLAALFALSTAGIQAGHMKLHAQNMAVTAGAVDGEIEKIVEIVHNHDGPITQQSVASALKKLRENAP